MAVPPSNFDGPFILALVLVTVKIPARSFLLDIGLVGLSCFALACSAWPGQPVWVVSWERPDGQRATNHIHAADRDEKTIRRELINDLTKNRSANVGMMRWQQESSLFYAETAREPITKNDDTVFRTAGYSLAQSESTASDKSSTAWQSYWIDRASRTEQWLHRHKASQAQRRMALEETIDVSRVVPLFPERGVVFIGLAAALIAVMLGTLWHSLIPPRTMVDLSTHRGDVAAPNTNRDRGTTETAAMSFRRTWVRVRQPIGVRLRQGCGWVAVLVAMMSISIRMLAT